MRACVCACITHTATIFYSPSLYEYQRKKKPPRALTTAREFLPGATRANLCTSLAAFFFIQQRETQVLVSLCKISASGMSAHLFGGLILLPGTLIRLNDVAQDQGRERERNWKVIFALSAKPIQKRQMMPSSSYLFLPLSACGPLPGFNGVNGWVN